MSILSASFEYFVSLVPTFLWRFKWSIWSIGGWSKGKKLVVIVVQIQNRDSIIVKH